MKLPHDSVSGTLVAGIALTIVVVIILRAVVRSQAG
jgi:hypothetical protein